MTERSKISTIDLVNQQIDLYTKYTAEADIRNVSGNAATLLTFIQAKESLLNTALTEKKLKLLNQLDGSLTNVEQALDSFTEILVKAGELLKDDDKPAPKTPEENVKSSTTSKPEPQG